MYMEAILFCAEKMKVFLKKKSFFLKKKKIKKDTNEIKYLLLRILIDDPYLIILFF